MNRQFLQMPQYRAKKKQMRMICFNQDPNPGGGGGDGTGFSDAELAALSAPEGETEFKAPDPPAGDPPAPAGETAEQKQQRDAAALLEAETNKNNPPAPAPGANEYLAPFSLLEKAYGVKVDTSKITPENAADALVQTVLDNYDFKEMFAPEVLALQKEIAAGKSFKDAVKQYAPTAPTSTDEDILSTYYEDTLGMTPEEAAEEIKGLTNKNIELRRAKVYMANKEAKQNEFAEQQRSKEMTEGWTQHVTAVEKDVDSLLNTFDNYTDIWGVKLSGADKDNFKPVFKKLMVPDPKTPGEPALFHKLLDNDETMLRVAYMLVNGQKLTSDLLSKPEEVRKAIEGKLFSDPGINLNSKNQDSQDDEAVLRNFSQPEQLIHSKN